MRIPRVKLIPSWVLLLSVFCILPSGAARAGNDILGEIRLIPGGKIEKLAGVWVDGQYVGYIGEMKGSKKLLLMPGDHQLDFRYSGFRESSQRVLIEPGKKLDVRVRLDKETDIQISQVTSEIKLDVRPSRAAVFLNGGYVGHVDEFNGPGQWMVVPSGPYDLRITLPGYLSFETQITVRPGQKLEVKTDLPPASIRDAAPLVGRQPTRVSQAQPSNPR
jgi:hypothetical protein